MEKFAKGLVVLFVISVVLLIFFLLIAAATKDPFVAAAMREVESDCRVLSGIADSTTASVQKSCSRSNETLYCEVSGKFLLGMDSGSFSCSVWYAITEHDLAFRDKTGITTVSFTSINTNVTYGMPSVP